MLLRIMFLLVLFLFVLYIVKCVTALASSGGSSRSALFQGQNQKGAG